MDDLSLVKNYPWIPADRYWFFDFDHRYDPRIVKAILNHQAALIQSDYTTRYVRKAYPHPDLFIARNLSEGRLFTIGLLARQGLTRSMFAKMLSCTYRLIENGFIEIWEMTHAIYEQRFSRDLISSSDSPASALSLHSIRSAFIALAVGNVISLMPLHAFFLPALVRFILRLWESALWLLERVKIIMREFWRVHVPCNN